MELFIFLTGIVTNENRQDRGDVWELSEWPAICDLEHIRG